MTLPINTPEGTRDRLFSECAGRRRTQGTLTHLFKERGFSELFTPEVEFYDLFVRSGNPLPQESFLKIVDRSGKIMVMRPDCTIPIARVAATRLKAVPLPQRLYYNETVFRSGQAHWGGSAEIAQCGVELIGAAGEEADREALSLAVEALAAASSRPFHIEVGHVGIFRALAAELGLDGVQTEQARTLMEAKHFAALNDFLEPFRGKPAHELLSRLSQFFPRWRNGRAHCPGAEARGRLRPRRHGGLPILCAHECRPRQGSRGRGDHYGHAPHGEPE